MSDEVPHEVRSGEQKVLSVRWGAGENSHGWNEPTKLINKLSQISNIMKLALLCFSDKTLLTNVSRLSTINFKANIQVLCNVDSCILLMQFDFWSIEKEYDVIIVLKEKWVPLFRSSVPYKLTFVQCSFYSRHCSRGCLAFFTWCRDSNIIKYRIGHHAIKKPNGKKKMLQYTELPVKQHITVWCLMGYIRDISNYI